jgi:conjugal transfer ATP-binding protein TraC
MNLHRKHSLMLKHDRFTHLFPTVAYEKLNGKTIMFNEDSQIGCAWISNPLAGVDKKTITSLAQALQLQTWKDDSLFQISLIASTDIEPFVRVHEREHNSETDVAKDLTQMRTQFWKQGANSRLESFHETQARDFNLVFSIKSPISGALPTSSELEKFEVHCSKVESILISSGFNTVNMDEKLLAYVYRLMLNGHEEAQQRNWTYEHKETVRHHFCMPGEHVELEKDHLKFEGSGQFGTVLSVKKLPEHHTLLNMSSLFGDVISGDGILNGRIMVTLNIELSNENALREKLEKVRGFNSFQAFGSVAKWFPSVKKKQAEFDSLFQKVDEGDRPVRGYLSVVLMESSKELLDRKVEEARSFFLEHLQINFLQDKFFTLPIFLNAFPLAADITLARDLNRYKSMSASQILEFAPILGDWKGTGSTSLTLFSRSGQIMGFDPFDGKKSMNGAIFAESGSGKSFLANAMITSEFCKENSKIFVIDIGGSYKKLASRFGEDAEFIDFDPETNFVLNPFEAVGSDSTDETIVITMLTSIIEMMAVKVESDGTISDGLSAMQSGALAEVVSELYREKGSEATIDKLIERCKKHPERSVQEVAFRLYKFSSESATGRFFNGKSTVSMGRKKMSVLELKHLEGMGTHVMGVAMFLMMSMIAEESFRADLSIRKLILLDEAWMTLKRAPKQIVEFLETFYRRIRKSNGSAWIITQGIEDLYESSAGVAISNNSPFKLYLGQTEASIARSVEKNYISISDYQKVLMSSTVNQKPHFSEVYIDADELGYGVGRLIVDRYLALMYSTEGQEVEEMDGYARRFGLNQHESILHFMHENKVLEGFYIEQYEKVKRAHPALIS